MGSNRRLAGYVIVDGRPYGPDDDLPEHIAVRITNPAAWTPDTPPTHDVGGTSPAPVTPDADVPDKATARRDATVVPATAVPDIAAPTSASTAPVTLDPAGPDEPTITGDETDSPDTPSAPAETGEVAAPAAASPPPRSGKGSGIEAWRAYARAVHVAVPDGAERADIITACEKAGHIPPQ